MDLKDITLLLFNLMIASINNINVTNITTIKKFKIIKYTISLFFAKLIINIYLDI